MRPALLLRRTIAARSGLALVFGAGLIGVFLFDQLRWAGEAGESGLKMILWSLVFLIGLGCLAFGLLRPIRRLKALQEASERRDSGDLAVRVKVGANDEIGALEASFNRSADEVNRTLEVERRFFSLSNSLLCVAGFDGYFKRLNKAWESTLGYSTDELLSKPWLEFIHPDDLESTMAEGAKLSTHPDQSVEFENRYICRDGSTRWLSWNAVPVPGQEVIYCVATDVTRRKASEAHLRQSQKMEAVGRFTAGIVHDFNNNLAVIVSNAELIAEVVGPDNRDVGEMIEDIVGAASHGAAPDPAASRL